MLVILKCLFVRSFVYLFVVCFLFVFSSQLIIFLPIWRRHQYRLRTYVKANFNLCSALMYIEQWRFFIVPCLLWHWPILYINQIPSPLISQTHIDITRKEGLWFFNVISANGMCWQSVQKVITGIWICLAKPAYQLLNFYS